MYEDLYNSILNQVNESLGVPDDIYMTWSNDDKYAFCHQYLYNNTVEALVDVAFATTDTGDLSPYDIEDLKQSIIEEVTDRLEQIVIHYDLLQEEITKQAYASILSKLTNSDFMNVEDVDVEYDPADPEVGVYSEERRIIFTLINGSTITFEVNFDD